MISTKIFIETIFVENFIENIFCNLKFFSKGHILRGKREKVILGSRLDSFHDGGPSFQVLVLFVVILGVTLKEVTHSTL